MKKGDPLERYSRHLLLKEIGGQGQQLLNKAKVLIIGLGGLGSPVLQYISGSGVGEIGLVDDDKVDISNLHRQPIYSMKDIGLYKVTQAKKFAHSINPNININIYKSRMTSRGTKNIIKDYDIIIDCTDNHLSSLAINDICFKEKKPLISASVAGFFGQVTTYRSFEYDGPIISSKRSIGFLNNISIPPEHLYFVDYTKKESLPYVEEIKKIDPKYLIVSKETNLFDGYNNCIIKEVTIGKKIDKLAVRNPFLESSVYSDVYIYELNLDIYPACLDKNFKSVYKK